MERIGHDHDDPVELFRCMATYRERPVLQFAWLDHDFIAGNDTDEYLTDRLLAWCQENWESDWHKKTLYERLQAQDLVM